MTLFRHIVLVLVFEISLLVQSHRPIELKGRKVSDIFSTEVSTMDDRDALRIEYFSKPQSDCSHRYLEEQ